MRGDVVARDQPAPGERLSMKRLLIIRYLLVLIITISVIALLQLSRRSPARLCRNWSDVVPDIKFGVNTGAYTEVRYPSA